MKRRLVTITGKVQGIGYRPFLYRRAAQHALSGLVRNDLSGVHLEIQGEAATLDRFIENIRNDFPAGARIDNLRVEPIAVVEDENSFIIVDSLPTGAYDVQVPLDSAVCRECLAELTDKNDRRYHYPFINCVACGPRYTIVESLPYDRPVTSMNTFTMCPDCLQEYRSPNSRRFHAQPNACPLCGPHLTLLDSAGCKQTTDDPLAVACKMLSAGQIVALKGLGGFHLACDARNREAVKLLRQRKNRPARPLAVMIQNIEAAKSIARIDNVANMLLTSRESPIVLVDKLAPDPLADNVAPDCAEHGVMIAYTPLHFLLLQQLQRQTPSPVLVMTSANTGGNPIVFDNEHAITELAGIADAFLVHDRPIVNAADDSIVRPFADRYFFLRRARGYAPEQFALPRAARPMLAVGTHLKSTVAFSRSDRATLSPHIGDLESYATYNFFLSTIERLGRLGGFEPQAVVCDAHPDLPSTDYARRATGLPVITVGHHRAHIAATLVDNGLWEPVIGVAFDGSGYGEDGTVWGGEFFIGNPDNLTRAAHLARLPLPGGDLAARSPWRMALALLHRAAGVERLDEFTELIPTPDRDRLNVALFQIDNTVLCPETSSAGRLFDAIAALVLRQPHNLYEAHAAIALEAAAHPAETGYYHFELKHGKPSVLDLCESVFGIVEDLRRLTPTGIISARFHNTVIASIIETCETLRRESGIDLVALGGGCFANRILLRGCIDGLQQTGFRVCFPNRLPPGDGCIALGQLALAAFAEDS